MLVKNSPDNSQTPCSEVRQSPLHVQFAWSSTVIGFVLSCNLLKLVVNLSDSRDKLTALMNNPLWPTLLTFRSLERPRWIKLLPDMSRSLFKFFIWSHKRRKNENNFALKSDSNCLSFIRTVENIWITLLHDTKKMNW